MKKMKKEAVIDLLKKYGYVVVITLLLIVVTEITVVINKVIDQKLDNMETDREKESLEEALLTSDKDVEGLNPYTVIWEYELGYMRERLPSEHEKEFSKYFEIEEWQNSINNIIESINSGYMSDEDIYNSIVSIMPEEIMKIVKDEYLKSIFKLNPDLGT